tara:strand:+ start:835 stop:1086 length:252 start_codon:yes stop_codon:yes gene_type:complete
MVVTIQGETMKIREKSEKEVNKKSKSILKSEKIANKILEQERQRALSERATRIKQYAEFKMLKGHSEEDAFRMAEKIITNKVV